MKGLARRHSRSVHHTSADCEPTPPGRRLSRRPVRLEVKPLAEKLASFIGAGSPSRRRSPAQGSIKALRSLPESSPTKRPGVIRTHGQGIMSGEAPGCHPSVVAQSGNFRGKGVGRSAPDFYAGRRLANRSRGCLGRSPASPARHQIRSPDPRVGAPPASSWLTCSNSSGDVSGDLASRSRR